MNAKERVREVSSRLRTAYPDAHCELDFGNALQLLVATILSAQCTDKRVNLVTPSLFERYRSARDFADAPQAELEEAIKSTGFYRNKAKSIRAMAGQIVAQHGGEVPRSMEALTALPGVGRKTANVVLGNAFGIEEGIVVDTHVQRLAHRLRFTLELEPEAIERVLMRLVPQADWTLFSHWLIWHGRRRCFARSPDCPHCEIGEVCPSRGKVRSKPTKALPAKKPLLANPLPPRN